MSQLALDGAVADPNADLVGLEFDSENGRLRVTGTAAWGSTAWMLCESLDGRFLTARATERLREMPR